MKDEELKIDQVADSLAPRRVAPESTIDERAWMEGGVVATSSGFVSTVVNEPTGKRYVVSTARGMVGPMHESAVIPESRSLFRVFWPKCLLRAWSRSRDHAAVVHILICTIVSSQSPDVWHLAARAAQAHGVLEMP
jgi:hypothetical protein